MLKKIGFKPHVIGILGTIASGKDSVANYIAKKYSFKKITLSNYLRAEARARGEQPTRDYLRKLQAELRGKYGNEYLVNKVIETVIAKDHMRMKNVLIVGLRMPDETKLAKDKLKATIILVDADPFIRYKRVKARGRKGDSKTYEQFLHEEAIENAMFNFHETFKMADFKMVNNGTMREMHQQINRLMKKIIKK